MRTLRTIAETRAHVAGVRARGASVALVPTMGALHAGHDALLAAAREVCDHVVVSLFVNPTQFEDAGDLAAYPREEPTDAVRAAERGADALLAPAAAAMYPEGFATSVRVAGLTDVLEGAVRGPEHFTGVCTVVLKLLNIVAPDIAVFGQKDAQQVAVLRRMVRDLDVPVRLEVVPTIRDPDGLALSSRNVRLPAADRGRALAVPRALAAAEAAFAAGERDAAAILGAARAILRDALEPEYLALLDPDSFAALPAVDGRPALVALAARVGPVRLIDNVLLTPQEPSP